MQSEGQLVVWYTLQQGVSALVFQQPELLTHDTVMLAAASGLAAWQQPQHADWLL